MHSGSVEPTKIRARGAYSLQVANARYDNLYLSISGPFTRYVLLSCDKLIAPAASYARAPSSGNHVVLGRGMLGEAPPTRVVLVPREQKVSEGVP